MRINDVLEQPHPLPERIGRHCSLAAPIESNAELIQYVRRVQLRIDVLGCGMQQLLTKRQALLIRSERRRSLLHTLLCVAGLIGDLRLFELEVADLLQQLRGFLLPGQIAGLARFEILVNIEFVVELQKSIFRIVLGRQRRSQFVESAGEVH